MVLAGSEKLRATLVDVKKATGASDFMPSVETLRILISTRSGCSLREAAGDAGGLEEGGGATVSMPCLHAQCRQISACSLGEDAGDAGGHEEGGGFRR